MCVSGIARVACGAIWITLTIYVMYRVKWYGCSEETGTLLISIPIVPQSTEMVVVSMGGLEHVSVPVFRGDDKLQYIMEGEFKNVTRKMNLGVCYKIGKRSWRNYSIDICTLEAEGRIGRYTTISPHAMLKIVFK